MIILWELAKLDEEERIDSLNYLEVLEDFVIGDGELNALKEVVENIRTRTISVFDKISEILRNVLAMLTINSYEMEALIC